MLHRWFTGAVLLIAAFGGWTLRAQREDAPKQIEMILKRLDALERRTLADPRLDRIENRLTKLEENSLRPRSGDPPPGFWTSMESRVQSLEREVARLQK